MLHRRHGFFAMGLAAALSIPLASARGSPVVHGATDDPGAGVTVVTHSLWGTLDKTRWRPLSLVKLFTEGWDEAYAPVPHEVPRQTWIGNADGAFYRLFVLSIMRKVGAQYPLPLLREDH